MGKARNIEAKIRTWYAGTRLGGTMVEVTAVRKPSAWRRLPNDVHHPLATDSATRHNPLLTSTSSNPFVKPRSAIVLVGLVPTLCPDTTTFRALCASIHPHYIKKIRGTPRYRKKIDILARGLALAKLVSAITGIPALHQEIRTTSSGKPYFPYLDIHYNTSACDRRYAIAISHTSPIGIDIAVPHLSLERASRRLSLDPADATAWPATESCIKSLGLELSKIQPNDPPLATSKGQVIEAHLDIISSSDLGAIISVAAPDLTFIELCKLPSMEWHDLERNFECSITNPRLIPSLGRAAIVRLSTDSMQYQLSFHNKSPSIPGSPLTPTKN